MKKTGLICIAMACIAFAHAQEVKRTTKGVTNYIQAQGITEEVQFYSSDIVRVVKYPSHKCPTKKNYAVVKTPEQVQIVYKENDKEISMKTENMEVIMVKESGKLTFKDNQGILLVQEKEYGSNFVPRKDGKSNSYRISQRFMMECQCIILSEQ